MGNINPEVDKLAEEVGTFIDNLTKPEKQGEIPKYGYVTLLFPFDSVSTTGVTYISNAQRSGVIALLKHFVNVLEQSPGEDDEVNE